MDNTLKDRLLDEMVRRNIKIPTLSVETGIPQDRIYKWFKQNTNPKAQDTETLNKWIKGELSSRKSEKVNENKDPKDSQIAALQLEVLKLRLDKMEANLNECLSNQRVLMTMLTVAMNNAADFYANYNKAKAAELRNKMMTEIASATKTDV